MIMAMITTSVAVILICIGSLEDRIICKWTDGHPTTKFKTFFLAFGTIMFAYAGHSAFPTIQHDMRKPYQFTLSVILAYTSESIAKCVETLWRSSGPHKSVQKFDEIILPVCAASWNALRSISCYAITHNSILFSRIS